MLRKPKLAQSKQLQAKKIISGFDISKFGKSKCNLLYLALAALILLSVFAVPKIAVSVVEQSRGKIVTVEDAES